jgi:hypothetical protein
MEERTGRASCIGDLLFAAGFSLPLPAIMLVGRFLETSTSLS